MSGILIEVLGPILILDAYEIYRSLEVYEGLKCEFLVELAYVEGKLPSFSLLMCPDLIETPDLKCMDKFLFFAQSIGFQYVFLNGTEVLRCTESQFSNSQKFSKSSLRT